MYLYLNLLCDPSFQSVNSHQYMHACEPYEAAHDIDILSLSLRFSGNNSIMAFPVLLL